MPDVKHERGAAPASAPREAADDRKSRLAAQLRANLRRRKERAAMRNEAKDRRPGAPDDEG